MTNTVVNVAPQIKIFLTFKNHPYSISTAICEFIDNSIANFHYNKDLLRRYDSNTKLRINIIWEEISSVGKKEYKLIIADNAFGLNEKEFEYSLHLQNTPKNDVYISKYGMGLKTAACWFGNYWEFISEQLQDPNRYSVVYDLSKFQQGMSEIIMKSEQSNLDQHGTVIVISQLNRAIGKINFTALEKHLQKVYQKWIKDEGIEIRVVVKTKNGLFHQLAQETCAADLLEIEPIQYLEDKIYWNAQEANHFKWDIKDCFVVNGNKYEFQGFFAIHKNVLTEEPGSAIYFFQQKRLVDSYSFAKIFKMGTLSYKRMFGHLEITDIWPVSQLKNKINWEGNMESVFQEKIKSFLTKIKIKKECSNIKRSTKSNIISELPSVKNWEQKFIDCFEPINNINDSSGVVLYRDVKCSLVRMVPGNSELTALEIILNIVDEKPVLFSLNEFFSDKYERKWKLTIFLKSTFFHDKKRWTSPNVNIVIKFLSGLAQSLIKLDLNTRGYMISFLNEYFQSKH